MKYINGVVGRKENSQSRNLRNLIHNSSDVSGCHCGKRGTGNGENGMGICNGLEKR